MTESALNFLIVEDSIELCTIWGTLFRSVGYEPQICYDGKSALELIDSGFSPEVIMTDFYLPDITGIDLIASIKSRSLSPHFIMVTGNRDVDFCQNIKSQDIDIKLLHKPVKFLDLKSEVDRLCK